MKTKKFDNLGIEPSLLGFGCMRFPLDEDLSLIHIQMCIRDRHWTCGLTMAAILGVLVTVSFAAGSDVMSDILNAIPDFVQTGLNVATVSYTHLDVYKRQV